MQTATSSLPPLCCAQPMNALSLWRLSRDSVLLPQPTLSSPGIHSPGKAAATPLIPGQAAGHCSPSLPGPPGGQSLSRPWHDAAGPGYSARRGPVGRAGGRPQIRHGWGKLSGFIQGVPRQKCSRVHCRSSSPLALQPFLCRPAAGSPLHRQSQGSGSSRAAGPAPR